MTIVENFESSLQRALTWQANNNMEEVWGTIKEGIAATAEQVLGLATKKKKP